MGWQTAGDLNCPWTVAVAVAEVEEVCELADFAAQVDVAYDQVDRVAAEREDLDSRKTDAFADKRTLLADSSCSEWPSARCH